MNHIELTTEQLRVVVTSLEFLSEKKNGGSHLTLGGYAGTGKTTVIKEICDRLIAKGVRVQVTSFAGKAVSVLRKKGIRTAKTLHSLMYEPVTDDETGRIHWMLKEFLPVDCVIIDEGSMISNELYSDIRSFQLPMLFVGDPGQLEPIGSNPNLMRQPDLMLTQIHRQAQESPILQLAHEVRNGVHIPAGERIVGDSLVIARIRQAPLLSKDVDQIICGFNNTRHKINRQARSDLGLYGDVLRVGDKLICVRNNASSGLFNGMMVTVKKVRASMNESVVADLVDDEGLTRPYVSMNTSVLSGEVSLKNYAEGAMRNGRWLTGDFFEYGYAITTHKSQGSEFEKVLVLEELSDAWDKNRWRYTAITRASKKLVYCR